MLILAVKGQAGNPIYYQSPQEKDTKVGGPFESSGNNSRYALTEAIVEDKTLFFDNERAAFSAPDIVYFNGKYFSLFAPGISFLGIPFYILGKAVGFPQLFTFLSTSLLALINTFLIIRLAAKFNVGFYRSIVAGFIFLFATNAFSYALTFTQHHASVSLMLLALLNALSKRTLRNNILLGSIFAAGVLIDIANIFLLSPIMIYVLVKHLEVDKLKKRFNVALKLNIIGLLIGFVPLIVLFGWYNYNLTGSPTTLGQNIGRSDYPAKQITQNVDDGQTSNKLSFPSLPFNPRKQLTGFSILIASSERGIFFYSPILLIGVLGFFIGYNSRDEKVKKLTILSLTVVAMNAVLYSMFHDPWGGWAFGPRYLIPSAAILAVATGLAIEKFKRNLLFILFFSILLAYSIGVNLLGALTTTQVPPKVEAIPLAMKWNYLLNWDMFTSGQTSSLFYKIFLTDKLPLQYYALIIIMVITAVCLILLWLPRRKLSNG